LELTFPISTTAMIPATALLMTPSLVQPPVEATEGEPLVAVTVAAGTQIGYAGRVYPGGRHFRAPASLVAAWRAYGWAEPG
jgi:hypothetical protein